MKTTILIVLFFFLTSIMFSQETKKISKNGMSFEYPIDWIERDIQGYLILLSEPAGKELTIMATFDVELDEKFKSVKDFYSNYKTKMKSSEMISEFKVKSKKEIKFKGYEAIEIYCSATLQNLPTEWKSIIFMKDEKIYKLTTTAMIGKFLLLKDKMDKVFESFTFE